MLERFLVREGWGRVRVKDRVSVKDWMVRVRVRVRLGRGLTAVWFAATTVCSPRWWLGG